MAQGDKPDNEGAGRQEQRDDGVLPLMQQGLLAGQNGRCPEDECELRELGRLDREPAEPLRSGVVGAVDMRR